MTRRVTLLLLCLTGCQPEIEFVEWDPLEAEEVEAALGEPTATLAELMTSERLQAIAERMPLLLEHTRFAAEVVDALGEAADVPPEGIGTAGSGSGGELEHHDGQGTVYYLGIGCPGTGPDRRFSTDNGVMRIDSERLDSLDPRALLDGGSVLFSFEDCQAGALRLNGKVPVALQLAREAVDPTGMLPLTESSFAMAADLSGLQANETELPLGVAGFLCRGFGSCAEYQDVQAEIVGRDEGTAVASFVLDRNYWLDPQRLALRLATAKGSASCEYDPADAQLDCDADPN